MQATNRPTLGDRPSKKHYLDLTSQLSADDRLNLCSLSIQKLRAQAQCQASQCKRCTFLPQALSTFLVLVSPPHEISRRLDHAAPINKTMHRQPLLSLHQFTTSPTHISLCSSLMEDLDLFVSFLSDSLSFLRETSKEISCSSHQALPGPEELGSSLKRLEARNTEISNELDDLQVMSDQRYFLLEEEGEGEVDSSLTVMDRIDESLVASLDQRGQGKVRELQRELMSQRRRMERVIKGIERGKQGANRHLLYILIHEIWGNIVSHYHQKYSLDQLIDPCPSESLLDNNSRLQEDARLLEDARLQEDARLLETNRALMRRMDYLEAELSTVRDEADSLLTDLSSSREALDRAHREIESLKRESSLMASEGRARARRLELKGSLHMDQSPVRDDDVMGDEGCPVCWSRMKDRVAFGCGHQTCEACGEKLAMCPLCRLPIMLRIKLF